MQPDGTDEDKATSSRLIALAISGLQEAIATHPQQVDELGLLTHLRRAQEDLQRAQNRRNAPQSSQ